MRADAKAWTQSSWCPLRLLFSRRESRGRRGEALFNGPANVAFDKRAHSLFESQDNTAGAGHGGGRRLRAKLRRDLGSMQGDDARRPMRAPYLMLCMALPWATAGVASSHEATIAARLTSASRVSTQGLGPVHIGVSKARAERAAGMRMRFDGPARSGCRYMKPVDARVRASLMLTRGRVVRVDVARRGIATPSGVRVGDSEASVRRRFAGQLRVTRHEYTDGYYLEFVPNDHAERNRRVIFETSRGRVSYIRAGRLPEVRYIEGCS
jgi:hypothetical protein